MTTRKAIEDLRASRNILAGNIKLFHEGHRDMYRVIAVELRKLLCDSNRGKDTSLLPQVVHDLGLRRLKGSISDEVARTAVFRIRSTVDYDGEGGFRITELFDSRAPRIPLPEWLDQHLLSSEVTIRQLIRSVADKESAHSDEDYDSTLRFARSLKMVTEDAHKSHIVAVGEYVLDVLTSIFCQHPDVFGDQ